MNKLTKQKTLAVLLPAFLIISTIMVFYLASVLFGKYMGYLIGFLFYWLFWCLIIPKIISGRSITEYLKDEAPFFRLKNLWIIVLLFTTIITPIFMYTISDLETTPLIVVLLGIPLSIAHSFFEELFWRGFYVKQFKTSIIFGIVIPTIFFMLWHIAPQFAIKSSTPVMFVVSTLPLGLTYALTAYVTKSAKWSFFAHSISGIFAFSGYLSMCLVEVLYID